MLRHSPPLECITKTVTQIFPQDLVLFTLWCNAMVKRWRAKISGGHFCELPQRLASMLTFAVCWYFTRRTESHLQLYTRSECQIGNIVELYPNMSFENRENYTTQLIRGYTSTILPSNQGLVNELVDIKFSTFNYYRKLNSELSSWDDSSEFVS